MKEVISQWPRLVVLSLICVLFIALYYYLLTIMGIVPLIGKEAPSIIIVWIAQIYLASNWVKRNSDSSVHFLKLFLYQYVFVILTTLLLVTVIYFFFNSRFGLEILQDYIRVLINENINKKDLIIKSEGKLFYVQFISGINGISSFSIIKNEFWEKIIFVFPVNLLISLYYKR